jgi:hypothetical protein
VFRVAVSAGVIAVYFCDIAFKGVCELEGQGAGGGYWELGGGDPTESEVPKPKESRGHSAIIMMAQEERRQSLHNLQMKLIENLK